MKTRYSSLVTIKKDVMKKSERVVQDANLDVLNAKNALSTSYKILESMQIPQEGSMSEFLSYQTLLLSQREEIKHNHEWVQYAQNQLNEVKQQLKMDMIEHEKFKYLEFQEIQKILKEIKIQEAKELDEVAIITHNINVRNESNK